MNLRLTTMTAAVALMFFTPIASYAQDIPPAPPGTVAPSAVDTKSDTYTQQKLDQMLAPIALYPDQLVSQILMASTFPLQIVQAARWLDNPSNAELKGDALVAALQPMNWDPSVKSITAFPVIVTMLNKNLDWTDSLGVAFTHQQSDVMAQIQFLRHQAQTAGNLASNDKIVCREDGPNIVIALANPNVVYAPYYNPAVVYGTWPWAEYPPVYFSPGYFGLGPLAAGAPDRGSSNPSRHNSRPSSSGTRIIGTTRGCRRPSVCCCSRCRTPRRARRHCYRGPSTGLSCRRPIPCQSSNRPGLPSPPTRSRICSPIYIQPPAGFAVS
ncbi:MAG TPA: DUF3300 domain-containing protein [Stellaceae bacterium]|nr:DUF3300 domain-containing protein [Stellaceae bacterium]